MTGRPRNTEDGPHSAASILARTAAGLLISLFVVSCGSPRSLRRSPAAVPGSPSAISQGFQAALPGYRFRFPADSGAHPAYKTEWWYYTGHLRSAAHEYGFELTFFRVGLTAHPRPRASRWAAVAIYLAHFAITDVDTGEFHYAERVDRGALGLSGADTGREHSWIQDWSASVSPPESGNSSPGKDVPPSLWPHHLQAAANFGAIDLTLRPLKPPAIQGQDGVSRKGPGYGQSSHYYSYTRLAAAGAVTIHGVRQKVTGLAWMDHEFGSSPLSADEVGWDWFSVQLDTGWDLMLYQLRLAASGTIGAGSGSGSGEGSGAAAALTAARVSPFSSGALVSPGGKVTFLRQRDFAIHSAGAWTSGKTGISYPARWEISVPRAHLRIEETPLLADQELAAGPAGGPEPADGQTALTPASQGSAPRDSPTRGTGVNYWEGAVRVQGEQDGRATAGEGYTELTGYGGPLSQLR